MNIITSDITGDEYDPADLAAEYGTLEHEGETLYLLNQATADNYGTCGEVRYYATAIDAHGVEYNVEWDTTEEWDLAAELDWLKSQLRLSEEEQERLEELQSMTLPDVSDESNACDWTAPTRVTMR